LTLNGCISRAPSLMMLEERAEYTVDDGAAASLSLGNQEGLNEIDGSVPIRTPPRTEGSVQLIQDETVVTLEADSLIVLEDTQGRLELNLVSGALLVEKRQNAPGKPSAEKGK
jgi:hypothetical protein